MTNQSVSLYELSCSIFVCIAMIFIIFCWYSFMKEKFINAVTKYMNVEHVMCTVQDERNSSSMWNCWLLFDSIIMMCFCKAHHYMNGIEEVDWLRYAVYFMVCIAKQKMEQMYPCKYNLITTVNNLLCR